MKTYLENKNKFQTKINTTKWKLKWNKPMSIMKRECVPEHSHTAGLAQKKHSIFKDTVKEVKEGCQV